MNDFYGDKCIVVTGGASFIGSHLVDALMKCNPEELMVVDDLSSGEYDNIKPHIDKENFLFIQEDLLKDMNLYGPNFDQVDILFHLAADHGGRGYIDSHPANCCRNMELDSRVFNEAAHIKVERVCFASSACIYPTTLQEDENADCMLKESDCDFDAGTPLLPDKEYGFAKLAGEINLKAHVKQGNFKGVSCRFATAYGPRENETHAVIALIAKAFIEMDPYPIWGDGKQDRNFTYVSDIVKGLMGACANITDGSAINIGSDSRTTIIALCEHIFDIIGWHPERYDFQLDKPVGVRTRCSSCDMIQEKLGFVPSVDIGRGLQDTIEWYLSVRDKDFVKENLERLLNERKVQKT